MKHISALIVKYIMTAFILEITLLLLTNLTFGRILFISFVVMGISYIIGDQAVLQATNNAIATIVDIALAIIIIYMFNFLLNRNDITLFSTIVASTALGAGEIFFHKIIKTEASDDDHMDMDHPA